MADHYPTGRRAHISRGDLLVATPQLSTQPWRKSVVFITEANSRSIMGTILNQPTLMTTYDVTDLDIPNNRIYMGGPISTHAMFMLHTSDFVSSNTLEVTDSWSVSSDTLMFEKLSIGDQPVWHRMYMGAASWQPQQLENELSRRSWMIINKPSFVLVTQEPEDLWQECIDHISNSMFENYI